MRKESTLMLATLAILAVGTISVSAAKKLRKVPEGRFTFNPSDPKEYISKGHDFSPLYMRKGLPKGAVYTDPTASPEDRAKDAIKRMTFEEKLNLTGGIMSMCFQEVPRLGLRMVFFSDASQGIHRKAGRAIDVGKTTAFPGILALAGTWNRKLATEFAHGLGEECKGWGVSVLLGPGANMYRHSAGGRNFEYMGEDPYLTSEIITEYIKSLQETGTMATIKHFIANDQEMARHIMSSTVSERALREIYLPPYKAAIFDAEVGAFMTGNNDVNGAPGAANKPLVGDLLRDEYGYKGIVMSDWANSMFWPERCNLILDSGHSLYMADNNGFRKYLAEYLKNNPGKKAEVEKKLEKMVSYNLYAFFKMGMYDKPYRDASLLKYKEHQETARRIGEEAVALLKNEDNILPITKDKKIVALGGKVAFDLSVGHGSGAVRGYDHISYQEALQKTYGDNVIVGDKVTDDKIKSADVVILFLAKPCGESSDIPFKKPLATDEVNRLSALNPNLVVVYIGGNGFAMPWIKKAKAVVFTHLLGQERGNILANVISGKVNPSGKLPFTIEVNFDDGLGKDFNKQADATAFWGGGRNDSIKLRKKSDSNP
jgi:beta-glucosidase